MVDEEEVTSKKLVPMAEEMIMLIEVLKRNCISPSDNHKFMMVDGEDLLSKKTSPMAEEILEMLRVCKGIRVYKFNLHYVASIKWVVELLFNVRLLSSTRIFSRLVNLLEVKQYVSTSVKEIDYAQLRIVNQAELKFFPEAFFRSKSYRMNFELIAIAMLDLGLTKDGIKSPYLIRRRFDIGRQQT
ncbi:hypothetical protein Tco_1114439 [Tanacetum coccineum]|uniref:Uncharacterized protein n=1 Tax=Tanacetum coccineum TaxID=301880 RepID=A0ABQ5IW52_9ASTR